MDQDVYRGEKHFKRIYCYITLSRYETSNNNILISNKTLKKNMKIEHPWILIKLLNFDVSSIYRESWSAHENAQAESDLLCLSNQSLISGSTQ